ncbi:MAG: tRNA (adenosine(37)-N6)-threonylcarbamoyltransferase complex ATPase subunit type 1 TsaE [Gemmatimonadaceae bacterium]
MPDRSPVASSGGAAADTAAARPMTLAELVGWGEAFGRAATAPRVVALEGDLGAGKTTLVQAIARGYGVEEPVTSPTFALVHEYHAARSPVLHLDLYRLQGEADLLHLGWSDIIDREALVLIEWPDRAGAALPRDVTRIALAHLPGDAERRLLTVR